VLLRRAWSLVRKITETDEIKMWQLSYPNAAGNHTMKPQIFGNHTLDSEMITNTSSLLDSPESNQEEDATHEAVQQNSEDGNISGIHRNTLNDDTTIEFQIAKQYYSITSKSVNDLEMRLNELIDDKSNDLLDNIQMTKNNVEEVAQTVTNIKEEMILVEERVYKKMDNCVGAMVNVVSDRIKAVVAEQMNLLRNKVQEDISTAYESSISKAVEKKLEKTNETIVLKWDSTLKPFRKQLSDLKKNQ
jgi:hypothetical protein